MISKHIDKIISTAACGGPQDFLREFSELADCAKKTFGAEKIHAVISDDIIAPARLALLNTPGVEISECDFTSLAAVDRAVRKNTAFAYCEYPSARAFRSFNFEKLYGFFNYFKITFACGMVFTDPLQCDINSGAPAARENEMILSRCAANAGRIYDTISRSAAFEGLDAVRVNTVNYIDYKNHRKLSKTGRIYISVGGGADRIDGLYSKIAAALDMVADMRGELNENILPYLQMAADRLNFRLYKVNRAGSAGLVIKAGTDELIADKFKLL